MIRRNVDVIAIAILLGVLAIGAKAPSIVSYHFFGHRQIVLTQFDGGRLMNVSCPLPPPVLP